MEKIDATFAKEFGFELEDHGTWFALYTTSYPIIKGDVINGKARNVVLSYETLPNFFNSFSPDIAMAYADRLTFTAHSACENHGRITCRNARKRGCQRKINSCKRTTMNPALDLSI